jgi:hypothetical protein
MSKAISYSKFELLPNHLKNEVNDFIDFLLTKETKKKSETKKTNPLLKFSGILSENEANEVSEIIKKDCDNIGDEW